MAKHMRGKLNLIAGDFVKFSNIGKKSFEELTVGKLRYGYTES